MARAVSSTLWFEPECSGSRSASGTSRDPLAAPLAVTAKGSLDLATRGDILMATDNPTFVRLHTTSTVGIDPKVDREAYPSHRYRNAERSNGCVTHDEEARS